jgi:hypothetical protein
MWVLVVHFIQVLDIDGLLLLLLLLLRPLLLLLLIVVLVLLKISKSIIFLVFVSVKIQQIYFCLFCIINHCLLLRLLHICLIHYSCIFNRLAKSSTFLLSNGLLILLLICHLSCFALNSILQVVVLNKLLKLFRFVLVKPGGIISPIVIVCPFFVHIFVCHELCHFEITSIRARFAVVLW